MTSGYRPWSKFNAHSWSILNARRHVITLEANKAVVIEAIMLATEDGANAMSEVLKRFKLTEAP